MITDFYESAKKVGVGLLVGSALAMSAGSAFAGDGARFYEKDVRHASEDVAQYGAGMVSNKMGGVTFLVYGGNEKLQSIARKVAKRLNAEGIPVGFIKALDRDTIDITMHVDFYTKGGTKYYSTVYDNNKNSTQDTEQGLYDQAKKAYEYEFGSEKSAKKSPSDDGITIASHTPIQKLKLD